MPTKMLWHHRLGHVGPSSQIWKEPDNGSSVDSPKHYSLFSSRVTKSKRQETRTSKTPREVDWSQTRDLHIDWRPYDSYVARRPWHRLSCSIRSVKLCFHFNFENKGKLSSFLHIMLNTLTITIKNYSQREHVNRSIGKKSLTASPSS
jgi:hypothetical protein